MTHYYYYTHRDEIRQKYREYSEAHRDEINAKARQRIADEIELSKTDPEVAAKREARLAKRREQYREYDAPKIYRETHREELNAKRRAYYEAHKEEIKAKRRQKYAEEKARKAAETGASDGLSKGGEDN